MRLAASSEPGDERAIRGTKAFTRCHWPFATQRAAAELGDRVAGAHPPTTIT